MKVPFASAQEIRAIGKKWIDMVNDEHIDERFSTGGFEEVPAEEIQINYPGPTFDQLVTKEDVQAALVSFARLARQSKRIADTLEKQTRSQKDIAASMRTIAVEIRKNKWN